MKIIHIAEAFVSIFVVVWIYIGVPLVIEKDLPLILFLTMSGVALYTTYLMIFTQHI